MLHKLLILSTVIDESERSKGWKVNVQQDRSF